MPTIRVNDADFYYELEGEGKPLICIAGYSCDHTQWLPLFPKLRKKFKTLIFDNRGIGRTKDDGRALTVDLMADDVIALAKALDLKEPHIIGQSMGGTIAQNVGVRYGGQIGKIVLLTTSPKWRKAMLLATQSDIMLREKGCTVQDLFVNNVAWIFGEKFLSQPENIKAIEEIFCSDLYPQSLEDQKRQFDVLKEHDGTKYLSKIDRPTLIIYGKEDLIALPQESEHLFTQIPNSQLTDMESGHGIIFEKTEELSKEIISFLV